MEKNSEARMRDYTMGGSIANVILQVIAYLFLWRDLNTTVLGLSCYILGLIGYFAYMGFRKSDNYSNEARWNGGEILGAFFASFMGSFVILTIQTMTNTINY